MIFLYYEYKIRKQSMLTIADATNYNNQYNAAPSQINNVNRFGFNGRSATIGLWLNANPNILNVFKSINQVNQLNTWVMNNAASYAQFASASNPSAKQQDIEFWFRGAIGEWFIIDCFLSTYGNTFLVKDPQSNKFSQESFTLATPTAYTGVPDYGVDLVGIDKNNKGVVGQVKFYNPWANEPTQINYETLSKTDCQGLNELWIDPKQERSIYLFWLGDKTRGNIHCNLSPYLLSNDCPLTRYNKIVYVDGNDLQTTILSNFWTTVFQNKINIL